MPLPNNAKSRLRIFGIIFFTLAMLSLPVLCKIFIIGDKHKRNNEGAYKAITPRDMKGIDTIRAGDSLYIIDFSIKKVIPDTVENESQDKYEQENYDADQ